MPLTANDAYVSDYADELIATPRAHLRLDLAQDERGLTLAYQGRELARCFLTPNGMMAGGFMAKALGVKLPPLGESVTARVSTGVLYRVLGVCQLDYSDESAYVIVETLLEEAEMQRGARNLSE